MRISDWSSDVCSSDLHDHGGQLPGQRLRPEQPEWQLRREIRAICSHTGNIVGRSRQAIVGGLRTAWPMQLDIVWPVIRGNLLAPGWRRRRISRDPASRVATSRAVLMLPHYFLTTP